MREGDRTPKPRPVSPAGRGFWLRSTCARRGWVQATEAIERSKVIGTRAQQQGEHRFRSRSQIQLSNSDARQASAISRRNVPEFCKIRSPRKQRAQGMPGAQCTRSLVCDKNKHTSIVTTVTPERPGIPRAMVLRLTSRSPRRPGLFDTVACASYRRLDASIGASERHDFAVRTSAIRQRRRGTANVYN